MGTLEPTPNFEIETTANAVDGPITVTAEIERALRLINPSMHDHKSAAQALRMVLRRRGVEVLIMGRGVNLT